MKKVFLLMMVAATMLFTQCKKNEVVKPTGSNTVEISLTLDNNSKINVNPSTGSVAYEKGDVIYVAYNHKYVGYLTHNGSSFVGSITIDGLEQEGEKLHFYSLGNKVPNGGVELVASTTKLEVNIMDQSEGLPVISYGMSKENYTSEGSHYSSVLKNWCALVKFNATSGKEPNGLLGQVGVYGMKNKVTVDLTNDSFTSGVVEESNGIIKLNKVGKRGCEYWAVLLPQEENLPTGEGTYAYSTEGLYGIFNVNNIQSIVPNGLYNGQNETGIVNVTLNSEREFSVSNDRKVRFSPGNLYYDCTTEGGYFLETNQGDFGYSYENGAYSENVGHVSRIKPIDKENAWRIEDDNVAFDELFCADNFTIGESIGWGVLSNNEWSYLFTRGRDIEIGDMATKLRINGIRLPDNYLNALLLVPNGVSIEGLGMKNEDFNNVQIDVTKFLLYESKGVVLLPCAGFRSGNSSTITNMNSGGFYWAKDSDGKRRHDYFYFGDGTNNVSNAIYSNERCIRLVKSVKE